MQAQHAVQCLADLIDGGKNQTGKLGMNAVDKTMCGEVENAILAELRTQSRLTAGLEIDGLEPVFVSHQRGDRIGFNPAEAQTPQSFVCVLRNSTQCSALRWGK